MTNKEYQHLFNLICGYFNQDWGLYFSDWTKVIDFPIAEANPIANQKIIADIERILEVMDEEGLETYFRQQHADIEPPYMAGMSHVAWLRTVRDMLRASHESFSESWQSYPAMVEMGMLEDCSEGSYRDPFPDSSRYRIAESLTRRLERPGYQGSLLRLAGSEEEIKPRLMASDSLVQGVAKRLVLMYAAGVPLVVCSGMRLKDDLRYLEALNNVYAARWGLASASDAASAGETGRTGILRTRERSFFNYLAMGCLLLPDEAALSRLFGLLSGQAGDRCLVADWLFSAFAPKQVQPLPVHEDQPDTGRYSYDRLWSTLLNSLSTDSAQGKQTGLAGYMAQWGELMRVHGWRPQRRYCPLDSKDWNCRGDDLFIEFAFEAALAVCAWDLDDSAFRDHPYYPRDLVDHYREHVRHTRDAWRAQEAGPGFAVQWPG